ncbi:DUF192 domain-containing protein [Ideonella sp. DXS29W]|uniref:DUF192 domain-containing protein n=1 Tax=Ideonella lacteola TaxID=2984193 RepID=A0ABU9BPS0_9BURK
MEALHLHIDGRRTALRIRQAIRWWSRAVGLLATPKLDDPCGIWIAPCNSVHTIGMRYPIDVVFVNADGSVAKVVERLRPWRAAGCRGARSTLELRAGLARELKLAAGMAVALAD